MSDEKPCGRLIKGKFVCLECSSFFACADVCPVYPINIRPYSAVCFVCDKVVIDGVRKLGSQEPLCLFE